MRGAGTSAPSPPSCQAGSGVRFHRDPCGGGHSSRGRCARARCGACGWRVPGLPAAAGGHRTGAGNLGLDLLELGVLLFGQHAIAFAELFAGRQGVDAAVVHLDVIVEMDASFLVSLQLHQQIGQLVLRFFLPGAIDVADRIDVLLQDGEGFGELLLLDFLGGEEKAGLAGEGAIGVALDAFVIGVAGLGFSLAAVQIAQDAPTLGKVQHVLVHGDLLLENLQGALRFLGVQEALAAAIEQAGAFRIGTDLGRLLVRFAGTAVLGTDLRRRFFGLHLLREGLGGSREVQFRFAHRRDLPVQLRDFLLPLQISRFIEPLHGLIEPLAHLLDLDVRIAIIFGLVHALQRLLPVGNRLSRLLFAHGEPQFAQGAGRPPAHRGPGICSASDQARIASAGLRGSMRRFARPS